MIVVRKFRGEIEFDHFFFSRYVNIGLSELRQLFFAKFDLKVHTDQGI